MGKQFASMMMQCRWVWIAATAIFIIPHLVSAQTVLPPTNFPSTGIGTSSAQQTLTFTGLPVLVTVSEATGTDFLANPTCNGTGTCTVAVTFRPTYPGLRQDAVLVADQTNGHVLGVGPVYGIGTAPQVATGPGVISTVANRASSALSGAVLNGIAIGPGGRVYISDKTTNSVYYVNPTSGQVILYAGNGVRGYSGDGGAATSAELNSPSALGFDTQADLFIADTGNNVIREVVAATGQIKTVAGTSAAGNSGDGGAATSAQLNGPAGVAVDVQGNVYISDTGNNRIRELTASNGNIVNFAGNASGASGYSGDGGAATSGALDAPAGITIDVLGNVFIADSNNQVIREVSGGNISTVAGDHAAGAGYSGDGGASTSAQLNTPSGVAIDAGGSLYIGDKGNHVIRKVTGDASHTITTIAGHGATSGYAGDGGAAVGAELNNPTYVALDGAANLFIVDSGNNAIREVTATAAPLTFPATANGSTSSPMTLTVSNTGDQNLTFSALAVSAPYSQTGGSCNSTTSLLPGASCTIQVSFSPTGGSTAGSVSITTNSLNHAGTVTSVALTESTGWRFVPMTPCRAVDTRLGDTFSGSFLTAGSTRDYILPSNTLGCSIPSTALAYSLNVTVVPHEPLAFLTLWQRGQMRPIVSILNSQDARIKANGAIIPADSSGGISVFSTNATELVLDVDGYFVPASASNYSSALQYYSLTPCRVVDTRNANGSLGGPFITNHTSRDFPVLSSPCTANVPSNVAAYSLNVTSVPKGGPVIYLTAWPTGQTQPTASIVNAPTGAITANGAIIPAGSSGDVSVYASNNSDVVIDINGYFAPPGTGLSLYSLTACRVLDTRNPTGSPAFSGTINVNVVGSPCSVPAAGQAYVMNATVVPQSALAYLTLWPAGSAQPLQSTLNADDRTISSNLAIVPTTNGSIGAYASSSTYLILDIFGYFAP